LGDIVEKKNQAVGTSPKVNKKGTNFKPKTNDRLVDYRNLERNILNEISKEFPTTDKNKK